MPARQNVDGRGAGHQADGSAQRGRGQSVQREHGVRRRFFDMRGSNRVHRRSKQRNHRMEQTGQGIGRDGTRRFGHALGIGI